AETVKEVLPYLDMVLLMTVNPGFGGQKFIPEVLPKISYLDELRKTNNYSFEIEIDGGVNKDTAKSCTDLGADVLVAGALFSIKKIANKQLTSYTRLPRNSYFNV